MAHLLIYLAEIALDSASETAELADYLRVGVLFELFIYLKLRGLMRIIEDRLPDSDKISHI